MARYTMDQYRGTSLLCTYTIPAALSGPENHEELQSVVNTGIANVIERTPILQVGIIKENSSKPAWITLASIDLSEHIKWFNLPDTDEETTEAKIQNTIASELDSKFFELKSRPGWRVFNMYTARELHVFFIYNHPHTDGMGGKIFHRQLLQELSSLTSDPSQTRIRDMVVCFPDPSERLPPPSAVLAKFPLSAKFMIKEAWNDYKPPSLFPTISAAKWAPIQTTTYKSCYKAFEIPSDVLSGVLAACRKYQSTLTSLLNTLALMSLAIRIKKEDAPAFASGTTVDQRRFLPSRPAAYPWFEPSEANGNYVSILFHDFDPSLCNDIRQKAISLTEDGRISGPMLETLWSTSSRVRSEIATRLEKGLRDDMIGLTKLVPDFRIQFKGDVKKPRKLSWTVTNIGAMDARPKEASGTAEKEHADWSITRSQFTNSVEVPSGAIMISVVSVKGGALVVTCTYQKGVVKDDLMADFVADLKKWLMWIGNTNRS